MCLFFLNSYLLKISRPEPIECSGKLYCWAKWASGIYSKSSWTIICLELFSSSLSISFYCFARMETLFSDWFLFSGFDRSALCLILPFSYPSCAERPSQVGSLSLMIECLSCPLISDICFLTALAGYELMYHSFVFCCRWRCRPTMNWLIYLFFSSNLACISFCGLDNFCFFSWVGFWEISC